MKWEHIKEWMTAMRTRPQMYCYTKEAFVCTIDAILRCHGIRTQYWELIPGLEKNDQSWQNVSEPVSNAFAEYVVDKAFKIFATKTLQEVDTAQAILASGVIEE